MHEILALRDINLPNPHLIKQLKAILSIESESLQDYGDEFYTKLADLMTNEPQETWDKLYFIPSISKPIIIKEDVASISKGTTGLCTWSASLHLIEFIAKNSRFAIGKKILELGSGAGLLGLSLEKIASGNHSENASGDEIFTSVTMTDLDNNAVINRLKENRERNFSKAEIVVLDWVSGNEYEDLHKQADIGNTHNNFCVEDACLKFLKPIDLVVGADIVFDPTVIPHLVTTLNRLNFKIALVSCTIRNEETFQVFLDCLAGQNLTFEIVEFENPNKWFTYPENLPILIVKILGRHQNE